MTVFRFHAELSGWTGGPGVNTFYARGVGGLGVDSTHLDEFADRLTAMYTTLKGYLAHGVSARVQTEVREMEEDTGNLVKIHGVAPQLAVQSSAAQSANLLGRESCLNVRLVTDAPVGNRMLTGRTFLGPTNNTVFGYEGEIQASAKSAVEEAYQGLLDVVGIRLVVWSQPKKERPGANGILPPQVGKAGYVQSVACQSVPGTLRSRKV